MRLVAVWDSTGAAVSNSRRAASSLALHPQRQSEKIMRLITVRLPRDGRLKIRLGFAAPAQVQKRPAYLQVGPGIFPGSDLRTLLVSPR